MTAPWNRSRPIYKGLMVDLQAMRHLFVLQGEGASALLARVSEQGSEFLARADVLYVAEASSDQSAALARLPLRDLWCTPTVPTLLPRLRVELANATMGMRLYVAGTEGFIGQVIQVALDSGIEAASVLTEHRGSLQRRVQCVHCKGITEDVRVSPVACSHCGLQLLVRDHYSRRIGAFQGVNIDAEEPGTAPDPEVLFP